MVACRNYEITRRDRPAVDDTARQLSWPKVVGEFGVRAIEGSYRLRFPVILVESAHKVAVMAGGERGEQLSVTEDDGVRFKDLIGKVALVTGASSGLGREFALSLAKNGCHVVVTARREDLLRSLCEEIDLLGTNNSDRFKPGKSMMLQLDVSAPEIDIDIAVERAWQGFGTIDVLVNNAGIRGSPKPPLHYDEQEWNSVMNTNLRGVWLLSKAVAKRMRDAGKKGSIINISSTASVNRGLLPGSMIYAVSKAGVNQITKSLALELGRYGIRVNAIASGIFKSDITKGFFAKDWSHKVATRMVPAQRWGSTDPDLTTLLLLLASDAASYVTGNVFIVDGGHTIPGFPLWSSL